MLTVQNIKSTRSVNETTRYQKRVGWKNDATKQRYTITIIIMMIKGGILAFELLG
jgi:hypothetical protein